MDKIIEEITEQDKMTAITGLRADMLVQYNWQKKMLHQIRIVSISTAFILLIAAGIVGYLFYINSQNYALGQRETKLAKREEGIRIDRESLLKRDSILLIREKIQDKKDSTYFIK